MNGGGGGGGRDSRTGPPDGLLGHVFFLFKVSQVKAEKIGFEGENHACIFAHLLTYSTWNSRERFGAVVADNGRVPGKVFVFLFMKRGRERDDMEGLRKLIFMKSVKSSLINLKTWRTTYCVFLC